MSAPRNRRAFERGQRRRALIRSIMLDHAREYPLAKPLTGEQIRARLRTRGQYLEVSSILWHVARIRLEADLAALEAEEAERSNRSSSSTVDAPIS